MKMTIREKKLNSLGERRVQLRNSRFTLAFWLVTFAFCLMPPSASAQDDEPAPPPKKSITKEDRKRLDGEADLRSRTKLAVDMMTGSIDAAERLNAADNFEALFAEFGHYRGLLEYTLAFLQTQDPNENKSLNNWKRFEISLRSVTPRIESIRRELPVKYEEYVRDLEKCMRDARAKVSEALFSFTVLPSDKESGKQ